MQLFCKNQNPSKHSEGCSKTDLGHVAICVAWPSKVYSMLAWSSTKNWSKIDENTRFKQCFGFSWTELPKWCQNDLKFAPRTSLRPPCTVSEATLFGGHVFACPDLERHVWVTSGASPILQPNRLVNANFCWQSQLPWSKMTAVVKLPTVQTAAS